MLYMSCVFVYYAELDCVVLLCFQVGKCFWWWSRWSGSELCRQLRSTNDHQCRMLLTIFDSTQ